MTTSVTPSSGPDALRVTVDPNQPIAFPPPAVKAYGAVVFICCGMLSSPSECCLGRGPSFGDAEDRAEPDHVIVVLGNRSAFLRRGPRARSRGLATLVPARFRSPRLSQIRSGD